jgi:hypothetical protein
MLRAQTSKNLIQTLASAIGWNAQGKGRDCAIICALIALPGVFFRENDFCFLMWNFHDA